MNAPMSSLKSRRGTTRRGARAIRWGAFALTLAGAVGGAGCKSPPVTDPQMSGAPSVTASAAGPGTVATAPAPAPSASASGSEPGPTPAPPALAGHDFGDEARILYRVAACAGDAPIPEYLDQKTVEEHCTALSGKVKTFRESYMKKAMSFFGAHVPKDLPKPVVYPFAGGDLVSALMAYPDAPEVTTISLELSGDPRRIKTLGQKALSASLSQLRTELNELLAVGNFSQSETLKHTQRGDIPGELGFFLVGLAIHDLEPVHMRYFRIEPDGALRYLDTEDIAAEERKAGERRKDTWFPPDFSEAFANVEITFRARGAGPGAPERVHRHMAMNLGDDGLAKSPGFLKHLEQKGKISAVTKAASYLMWSVGFKTIRDYLLGNMTFMVSDSTGIPPTYAKPAGFEHETYGSFIGTRIPADQSQTKVMRDLWRKQPKRDLAFRFGYLDSASKPHLLITSKVGFVGTP
ncbi:MAG: hypothetical protein HY908_24010 [Myxococcales bacterium]|nr:hypothetical protein [Myxococcales bacterium]